MTTEVMEPVITRTQSLKAYLLGARERTGFGRGEAVVLGHYTLILAWAIGHYQPFADEAQAWLMSSDCSLHELLFRRLHYEGAPALWPLMLWVAARLHLPYLSMNWVGGAFAVAGIYILLRFSPFPRLFRWLLPFTFFLQYQYGAIARPYVLFPALIFLLCLAFSLEKPRPILFASIAGLLANISFDSAVIAGIFSLLYLHDLHFVRRLGSPILPPRRLIAAAGVFVVFAVCSIAAAFPAPDVTQAYTPSNISGKHSRLLLELVPEERLPQSAPALDPPLELMSWAVKARKEAPTQTFVHVVIGTSVLGLSVAFFSVAESSLLAMVLLGSLARWLWIRRCLRFMLPFVIAIPISVQLLILGHHAGQFFLSLVAAAWIGTDRSLIDPHRRSRARWTEYLFSVAALLVIVLQIGWSFHCIRNETYTATDPGRETEAFLASHSSGKRIASFGFESISTMVYAQKNPFFNQPHRFWVWSVDVLVDRRRTEALMQHPDVVVVGELIYQKDFVFNQILPLTPPGSRPYPQMLEFWEQHGYHVTHRFCGQRFIRMGVNDTFCENIMER